MKLITKISKLQVVAKVGEAMPIPKFHAFVRFDVNSLSYTTAIIPLNFLLRAWYWFYVVINKPFKNELWLQEAMAKGYFQGRKDGFNDGMKKGAELLFKRITEECE